MFDSRIQNFERLAYSDGPVSYAFPRLAMPIPALGSRLLKRIEDIVIALAVLTALGVLMLAIALAIRLTSKGPALFMQERTGLHGKPFRMLKFRTMRHDEREEAICRQAVRNDPRVTWLGALLRRSSFDELPQLLNVLGGTMSVVGPRPHAPGTCAAGRPFETITHHYAARHRVKPGMTGLAQVRGWRGETDTEEKLLRRVDSDLEYIATWSIRGDLTIVCRTVAAVLCMRNAW
jgi:lipopolysaccharide/colanic/teichoic acid biosynthesis glycosyltransferase